MTGEITPTPWGDLEVYEYNGKYTDHRAQIDSSETVNEIDVKTIEFNPWQYADLSAEWDLCVWQQKNYLCTCIMDCKHHLLVILYRI